MEVFLGKTREGVGSGMGTERRPVGSEAKERPKDGDYGSTLWGALETEWVTPQGGRGICTTVPVSHW